MSSKKKVLVVLPSTLDRHALSHSTGDYEFHWLSAPDLPTFTVESSTFPEISTPFNPEEYITMAIEYVKTYSIDAVFYSTDIAGFLAAVICEQTGLYGPTIESQFLCIHKYYSRKAEPSKLWFDAVVLTGEMAGKSNTFKYPCYVKPAVMTRQICLFPVMNEKEMEVALATCRKIIPPWFTASGYRSLFEKYIDAKKYPLAATDIAVVEELVDGATEHCVEGWVDSKGKVHIWLTSDECHFTKPGKAINGFILPSQMPKRAVNAIELTAKEVATNHGLKNTFFNIEMWYRCENGEDRVDVTEVNNRICAVYHELYNRLYGTSSYYAALHLACSIEDQISPIQTQKQEGVDLIAGQFSLTTLVEGIASELIDYEAVEKFEKEEGIFSCSTGGTELDIVSKSYGIKQLGSVKGVRIGKFCLFERSLKDILDKADDLRSKLFRRPSTFPYEHDSVYITAVSRNQYAV